MDKLEIILRKSVDIEASDIYIVPGTTIRMRVGCRMQDVDDVRLRPMDSEALLSAIYELAGQREIRRLLENGDGILQGLGDVVSDLTGIGASNEKASDVARMTGSTKSSGAKKKTTKTTAKKTEKKTSGKKAEKKTTAKTEKQTSAKKNTSAKTASSKPKSSAAKKKTV